MKSNAGSKGTNSESSSEEQGERQSDADHLLKSILEMLKLETLGFTTSEDDVVGLINQWQRLIQDKDHFTTEETLSSEALSTLQARLPSDQIALLRRTSFNRGDIDHLRALLLLNASVQNSAENVKTDLDRVVNVFQNLIRNTDLIANRAEDLPLSLFQLSLLGKTTAAERAWLFTELLRQLRIDCVIIAPANATEGSQGGTWDAAAPFLIGVLVNKDVYLFDPSLGLPLTVPASSGKKSEIATLKQAQVDAGILRQYDLDSGKPYPISAEMLTSGRILISGDPSIWSYRFERLQVAFTGSRSIVISDRLLDRQDAPGLISRVTNWPAKSWKPDQVGIWAFPATQLTAISHLSAQQKYALDRMLDPLKMPLRAETITSGERSEEIRIATNQFMLARMDHAQGLLDDAIKGYTVSLTRLQNPKFKEFPQRSSIAYKKALEDTRFWMSVCKLGQEEQNDVRIAQDKLMHYLKSYPEGEWSDACHALLAELLAASGEYATAIEEISKIPADHPQHRGFAFQKQAWEKLEQGRATTPVKAEK